MAVVDKSGSINSLSSNDSPTFKYSPNATSGAKKMTFIEKVSIASGDDDGSKYRVARISSNSILTKITILHSAVTGGTDFDLGFYDTPDNNSGAAIDKDYLLDGQTLANASRNRDGFANVALADIGKAIHEQIDDINPNQLVDIVLTGNTVGTVAGTVVVITEYTLI